MNPLFRQLVLLFILAFIYQLIGNPDSEIYTTPGKDLPKINYPNYKKSSLEDPIVFYSSLFKIKASLLKSVYASYESSNSSPIAPSYQFMSFCRSRFLNGHEFCNSLIVNKGSDFIIVLSSFLANKSKGGYR